MLTQLRKLAVTYNPILDTCILLHTRRGLVNAIGVLVVDVVLLLAMLIGLLQHVSRNSPGIWKVLYQQVSPNMFCLVPYAESLLVHNVVGVGIVCRNTSCGLSDAPFSVAWYSAHVISRFFRSSSF